MKELLEEGVVLVLKEQFNKLERIEQIAKRIDNRYPDSGDLDKKNIVENRYLHELKKALKNTQ